MIVERQKGMERFVSEEGIRFVKLDLPIEQEIMLHNYSAKTDFDFEAEI